MSTSGANLCEVKGIIASKQGLSCSGYFTLADRTARLRERVYVTVSDGDKLFLPKGAEHFPVHELEGHYLGRMKLGYYESIGAGGGEVVFICEGPAADEGATVIEMTLPALEELLNRPLAARWAASRLEMYRHLRALQSENPPYRPEVLPMRAGPPEPVTEEERKRRPRDPTPTAAEVWASMEEKQREVLKRMGLLEEAERYGLVGSEASARNGRSKAPARRADPVAVAASWTFPPLNANQKFNQKF